MTWSVLFDIVFMILGNNLQLNTIFNLVAADSLAQIYFYVIVKQFSLLMMISDTKRT